jgi:hypothetical protein
VISPKIRYTSGEDGTENHDEYCYYWILGQLPNQTHVYLYAKHGANVTFNGTITAPVIISVPPDEFVFYNLADLGYNQNGTQWYFLEMYSDKSLMVNFDRAVYLKTGSNKYEWVHGDQIHNMPLNEFSTTYYLPMPWSGSGDDILIMYSKEPTFVTVRILGNSSVVATRTVMVDGLYNTGYLSNWILDILGYSLMITSDKPIAAACFDECGWWPLVYDSGYFFSYATYTDIFTEYMHIHSSPFSEYHKIYTPTPNRLKYYDLDGNLVNTDDYLGENSDYFYYSDIGYSGSPDPFLAYINSSLPYADGTMSPKEWFVNDIVGYMGWNSSIGTLEIYSDHDTKIRVYNGRNYTLLTEFDMNANSIFRENLVNIGFQPDYPFLAVVVPEGPVYQAVKVPYYVRPYPAKIAPDVISPPQPPTLYINTSQDGRDAILSWDPVPDPRIEYYILYRSTSQIDFDFNMEWINTSKDYEFGEGNPIPLRTMWNDTNAAFPNDINNYKEQYYYILRAVNILGQKSSTSRTVGKWTKAFFPGVSTFSLPLEPLKSLAIYNLTNDMNASYIKWMDLGTHTWRQHNLIDSMAVNNTIMSLGEGYEVNFDSPTNYTFTGMPAAMISYNDRSSFLGFDHKTEAKNLVVTIEPGGVVNLTWQEPLSMSPGDWYEVYYSNERDGFFGSYNVTYFSVCSPVFFGNNTVIHSSAFANSPGARLYYMLIPYNARGFRGASTYSIGLWTEEYLSGYDTLGIPLKQSFIETADWYCDNIPDTVGINYFNINAQRWNWHSTRMPQGAYDPVLEMTEGYQISTSNTTKFTFIGV